MKRITKEMAQEAVNDALVRMGRVGVKGVIVFAYINQSDQVMRSVASTLRRDTTLGLLERGMQDVEEEEPRVFGLGGKERDVAGGHKSN